MDIARILGTPNSMLSKHPFDAQFMQAKSKLSLKEIHFYDFSKMHEASFGLKELRELTQIPGCKVIFDKSQFNQSELKPELLANRPYKRKMDFIQTLLGDVKDISPKQLPNFIFHYNSAINSFTPKENAIQLNYSDIVTQQEWAVDFDIIIKSIGLISLPIKGLPFESNIIPNIDGRIVFKGNSIPKLYVAGWGGTKEKGNIEHTKKTSEIAISSLLKDIAEQKISEVA